MHIYMYKAYIFKLQIRFLLLFCFIENPKPYYLHAHTPVEPRSRWKSQELVPPSSLLIWDCRQQPFFVS